MCRNSPFPPVSLQLRAGQHRWPCLATRSTGCQSCPRSCCSASQQAWGMADMAISPVCQQRLVSCPRAGSAGAAAAGLPAAFW